MKTVIRCNDEGYVIPAAHCELTHSGNTRLRSASPGGTYICSCGCAYTADQVARRQRDASGQSARDSELAQERAGRAHTEWLRAQGYDVGDDEVES